MKKIFIKLFIVISQLIPKNSRRILLFIDIEIVNGKKIFHKEDNVFLFYQYLLKANPKLIFTIISSNNFGGNISWLLMLFNNIKLIYALLFSKCIIGKMPIKLDFITKNQRAIFLGYYIPFKADRLMENCLKKYDKHVFDTWYKDDYFNGKNVSFITSSKYSSDIISKSMNIPRTIFRELGNPKDTIRSENTAFDIKKIFNLDFDPQKIILYAPTFRDRYVYNVDNPDFSKLNNIFGFDNEIEILNNLLVSSKTIIIVKLHKTFKLYREIEDKLKNNNDEYFKNCYFLTYEKEKEFNITAYHLFNACDAMIADYSSISFDFLTYDKPIIYYAYDIEEYRKYRGFSYEPVEDIMAGPVAKNIYELEFEINNIINNIDCWKAKRLNVKSIINEVKPEYVMNNIYNYMFNN